MGARYVLCLLRSNWRFLAVLTIVATAAGLLTTYVLPEEYEASTKILIRPEKDIELETSTKEMMDYPVGVNLPAESISQTYAEIMVSEAVAAQVVDILSLHERIPEPDPRWYVRAWDTAIDWTREGSKYTWEFLQNGRVEELSPYRKAVKDVREGLSAEPVQDTYIFTLTSTMANPKLAAVVADTASTVFVDYSRKARQGEDGSAAAFVGESLDGVKNDLDEARARVDEFRERVDATSLNEELSMKLDAIAGFEKDREEAWKGLREVEAEIGAVRAQMASVEEEIHSSTTLEKNALLEKLKADLAGYQVELAGLQKTLTSSHPQIQRLEAQIGETERGIESESDQVRSSDTHVLNPIHQDLERRLIERTSLQESLQARIAALSDSIDRYRKEINTLGGHRSELARLTLQVEVLEDSYRLIAKSHEETRLSAAREISEIRVLHAAVPPLYPNGPIKIYYAGGAMATGLLLGIALLLLQDYLDRRIRSREDLQAVLGMPALAAVPRVHLPPRSAAFLGAPGSSSTSLSMRMLARENTRPGLEGK